MEQAYAPTDDRPRLRLVRDEDATEYDGQPVAAPFVMVDRETGETILASLGGTCFGVWWHLLRRSKDGACWPSLDDIADATKLSRKHVTRCLDALEEAGWITRTKRTNAYGMATSTLYRLHVKPRTSGCDIDGTEAGHALDTTPSKMSHELEPNKIPTRTEEKDERYRPVAQKPRPTTEPPAFAAFYDRYPRHEGRAGALAAWRKLDPDEALVADVMAGLDKLLPEYRSREARFVPLPATWLNGRRWTDEPPTTTKAIASPRNNAHSGTYTAFGTARRQRPCSES